MTWSRFMFLVGAAVGGLLTHAAIARGWATFTSDLLGSVFGGLMTLAAAWYTFKEQSDENRKQRLDDAKAERELRNHERETAQRAFDRNATRLLNAQLLGLKYADDPLVIFEHLRELRRMIQEHPGLFLLPYNVNKEFYANHLAGLPAEGGRTMEDAMLLAKNDVASVQVPHFAEDEWSLPISGS